MLKIATLAIALNVLFVSTVALRSSPSASAAPDPRYFAETGFRVSNDRFWDYFSRRGGVETFGYPVSRELTLLGFQVQIFQGHILQLQPDGSVVTMNLLQDGLMPVTRINGSTFPAEDRAWTAAAPQPTAPAYAQDVVEFTRQRAPASISGLPVRFFDVFMGTVSLARAFPVGGGNAALVPLLNLEIWGVPTAPPAADPTNATFVYQRFQRSIMHFRSDCQCTERLLLADWFKAVITGQGLPPDLAADMANSPFLAQYDPSYPESVRRPDLLPETDLTDAFVTDAPLQGPPSNTTGVTGLEYGINMFLFGNAATTERDLRLASDAAFGWQKSLFQWRAVEGACKGCFDWREADRVVARSRAAGMKLIARIDFQPPWSRTRAATNGPPDNYQDYADFIAAVARRYGPESPIGQVHAIEIWNEPNLDREWGGTPIDRDQAADYVRLLRLAHTAAKQANPSIIIITAGLSPTCTDSTQARPDDVYLQWLYDAGAQPYFDVLGAHGAGYDKPPSASPEESALKHNGCRVFAFRRVEDLRAVMIANGDAAKRIWLLEFGWTTDTVHPNYAWHSVSPSVHAQYLVDAYRWAREHWSSWIGVMAVWTMPDPNWGTDREEYWWGITNPSGTTRPAYELLQASRRAGLLP